MIRGTAQNYNHYWWVTHIIAHWPYCRSPQHCEGTMGIVADTWSMLARFTTPLWFTCACGTLQRCREAGFPRGCVGQRGWMAGGRAPDGLRHAWLPDHVASGSYTWELRSLEQWSIVIAIRSYIGNGNSLMAWAKYHVLSLMSHIIKMLCETKVNL